ncbi:MAG: SUMF1/EgtB/PvdO family nonheme iron enzyme [Planctomycetes bacterium]|nr:SUMF1/EgtB/PvdO family nonheme iron enzyme [Planctomycetota bacterium]
MAEHDERASASAKELFALLVERHDRGERVDWDAELARHPERVVELRKLHSSWMRVESLLAGLTAEPESLASAAREALAAIHPLDETSRELLANLSDPQRRLQRYREIELIARGGMGEVSRVFDRELERELALKSLHRASEVDGALDGRALRRFLMEARIAARLEHPGILPVHDLGVDAEGRPYFTMPLVRGKSLAQVLELVREGREGWGLASVLEVILKVCDALAYAHEQGVVHRDLKPANILVGRFGETYVMDWGLARASADSGAEAPSGAMKEHGIERATNTASGPATAHGAVLGTVQYMSPEQARGELDRIGPRSDVYAIGAILHHALSGRMPFHGVSEEAALTALRRGPPRSLEFLAPSAPRELVSICEKAMAREAEGRYRGCAELAADLRAYMEGRVVAAHEAGALAELRKWVVRKRLVLVLGLVVVVIAVSALYANRWIELERRSENALLAEGNALDELLERAPTLWPAVPEARGAFTRWITDAEALVARLPEHEHELARLRSSSQGHASGQRHRFEDPGAQWRHDTLARLVKGLQVLSGGDPATSALADARSGLAFASSVEERSLVAAREAWTRAIADAASAPVYGGLRLVPQVGLVPLGPDPASGLQEFAELSTGLPPSRDREGRLQLRPESAVVLVLGPAARVTMGSVVPGDSASGAHEGEADLLARADETPCVAIELEPFLLARHELTREQWDRIAPAHANAPSARALLPVDTVSWHEARAALARVGLVLPTEAQWECAARGGGNARFWCGREVACLVGRVQAGWLPDGRALHGTTELASVPVSPAIANAWGFEHVAGNVAEWVQDAYVPTLAGVRRPGDGLAIAMESASRVVRGGSFLAAPADLRCAARNALAPETRSAEVGVRPARALRR